MSSFKDKLKNALWFNEPPKWAWVDNTLEVTTGEKTDFWQNTYYDFRRDDGHFLGTTVSGDFTAVLTFEAKYQTLYDQAGLMIRRNAENWVKAGIEFSDGMTNFSIVITRDGRSDWSVIGVPDLSGPQKIRLTRIGNAIIAHHLNASGWQLMRLGESQLTTDVLVGPTTCSPQRSGLDVRFLNMELGTPIDDPLHAN